MKGNAAQGMALCLALATMSLGFLGCSQKTSPVSASSASGSSASTSSQSLSYAEINVTLPSDVPNDADAVFAEVNKEVKTDLNTKVNMTWIPWGDYDQKIMLKLSSGDDLDLFFDAPWWHESQLVAQNAIQAWDPYLQKYGPNIQKSYPQQVWDANKVNGKIMFVPNVNVYASKPVLFIRKDLREKYGLSPITTLDGFEAYLTKVKQNEPGMIPFTYQGTDTGIPAIMYRGTTKDLADFDHVPILSSDAKYQTIDSIKPIYETQPFLDWCKLANKWYNEGLIDKDIMTQKDDTGAFTSGKAASQKNDLMQLSVIGNQLSAAVKGAQIEAVDLSPNDPLYSDYKANNCTFLNAKSKNPERAVMFADWVLANQDHYDLLHFGIKGKDFTDTGDKTFSYPSGVTASTSYNLANWQFLWCPVYDRLSSNATQAEKDFQKKATDSNQVIADGLTGFNSDLTPVKNEVAKVDAIWAQTICPLSNGLIAPTQANIDKAAKALENAGYLKTVQEAQKQVNAFLSTKK